MERENGQMFLVIVDGSGHNAIKLPNVLPFHLKEKKIESV